MRFGPPVSFAHRRDGRHLAYRVGGGELDLVFLFGFPTNVALPWDNPAVAGFLGKLLSFSRLILFDRLGNGLSDRGPTGHAFEDWMDDLRCVLAAAGSERAALFGCDFGGRLALLLAATYPDEMSAVVTFASRPTTLRGQDYPWGATARSARGSCGRSRRGRWIPPASLPPWRRGTRPTPRWSTGGGRSSSRPSARRRPPRSSGRSTRSTSASCSGRSRRRCWCCTAAATGTPTCAPVATWPSGCPTPGWWSCRRRQLPVLRRPGRGGGAHPGVPHRRRAGH